MQVRLAPFYSLSYRKTLGIWDLVHRIINNLACNFQTSSALFASTIYDKIYSFRTLFRSKSKKDELASHIGHEMLLAVENNVDNDHLRDELVKFAMPRQGPVTYSDVKDVFPWVTKHEHRKTRLEHVIRENNFGDDNKIFRRERVSEVELKGIVKFLLRHDNVQDVAFGARIYKMEDSSENF